MLPKRGVALVLLSLACATGLDFRIPVLRRRIASLLVPLALSISLTPPFALPSEAVAKTEGYALFNEVWSLVNENFVDPVPGWDGVYSSSVAALTKGADEKVVTRKMLKTLGDKYTRLLDKNFYESLWKYDAIGVGLLFQSDPNKPLTIASPPISGSTGALAGIHKGDLVYSINGRSTKGMTAMQVLDMMSNNDESIVILEVATASGENKRKIDLVRATEKAKNPVTYSVETLKDKTKVGYISLGDFNSLAVPGLKDALVNLQKSNVDDIVLDIRGNTGGGFQFALNIGGMFMDDKEMATARGKDTTANVFRTSYSEGVLTDKPLVLLVDGLSASASEVLAGGLHDNCRAVMVGSKTFGKGKIQAVFGLADGEGLTMTVAQYVTPKGTIIQSRGLEPDIPLETLNPFIAHYAGAMSKPDLNLIDFHKVQDITKACSASVVTASSQ